MSEENSVMKKLPDGRRIIVHKQRTSGAKYHLHQYRMKHGLSTSTNEKSESDAKTIDCTVLENKNSLFESDLISGDHESVIIKPDFQSNANLNNIDTSTAYLNDKKLDALNEQSKTFVKQPDIQNIGKTNNFTLKRIFNIDSIMADIEAYSKEHEQHLSRNKNMNPGKMQANKEHRMQLKDQKSNYNRVQSESHMNPPANPVKKRKRKKRNLRQRIIQSECYEPEILLPNTTYRNHNKIEEENYPICPSPASTGSLTQSIFHNKDYKESCKNTFKECRLLPFNLSSNSNSTASVKNFKTNNSLPDTSSNTSARHEKTTITLSDNTVSFLISQQQSEVCVVPDCEPSQQVHSSVTKMHNKPATESSQIQIVDLSSDDASGESELDKSQSILENYQTANDFAILEHETSFCTNNNNDTTRTSCIEQTMLDNIPKINTHWTRKTVNANEISKKCQLQSPKRPVDFAEPSDAECVAELENFSDISSTFYTSSGSPKHKSLHLSSKDNLNDGILPSSTSSSSSSSSLPSVQRKIPSSKIKGKDLNSSYSNKSEFTSVTRLSLRAKRVNSSQSSISSSNEYLCKESKICLVKIAKVMANHYDLPVSECVSVLKSNSYSLLPSLQDLQLLAISSSEISEI